MKKKRLVVERVLSGALARQDHAYDASKGCQKFLYVGGEAELARAKLSKAIVAGMDLILRKKEVILSSTLATAVLDLKHDPNAKGQDGHKKYYSSYVQLSRRRSSDGLYLLQRFDGRPPIPSR